MTPKTLEAPPVEATASSPEEIREVQRLALAEAAWYKRRHVYRSGEEITAAVASGKLKRVEDGLNFKLTNRVSGPCLRPEAHDMLESIVAGWVSEFTKRNGDLSTSKLIISSLLRTPDIQQGLIAGGAPAASGETSTHLRGGAIDFSIAGFIKYNNQAAIDALRSVLEDLAKKKYINFIHEVSNQVFHVAVNPRWHELDNKKVNN